MPDTLTTPEDNAAGRRPEATDALARLPKPVPSAGVEAYVWERELALAASPAKRENYEKFKRAKPVVDLDYLPVKLDIENVSRCNFRCTMCVVSDWDKGQRAADLPLEAFKDLIDSQVGLVEIKLQGIGEPLMQRDDFFAMIRYARDRHIWVRTTTNASLLHLNDNARKLVDADPNEIQISVDGADAETFAAIRRGGDFDRVTENCKLINAYCRDKGVRRTKMWTLMMGRNVDQGERLVDLAAELGFQDHVFAFNLNDWGLEEWRQRNDRQIVDSPVDVERMLALAERGRRLGVRVGFWDTLARYSTASPDTICPWPFERAYVSSDQRVVPCCLIGNPDVYEIGDKADFTAVWTGPDYAEFRRAHLEGRPPDICRACYAGDS